MDDERQAFFFDPQVPGDAGQEPGQGQAQLVQASRGRRSAQLTRLPPFGAVRAVDHDAWYGAEAADTEQRRYAPAGDDGEGCSRGPHVAQDPLGASQRTCIVGVR